MRRVKVSGEEHKYADDCNCQRSENKFHGLTPDRKLGSRRVRKAICAPYNAEPLAHFVLEILKCELRKNWPDYGQFGPFHFTEFVIGCRWTVGRTG
jgi:hypothetical protein